MARLNKSSQQILSLFPMVNILVCTIGSLILVVGSVLAFSLGPARSVSIEFYEKGIGKSHLKNPEYIEWDGKNVTILPSKDKIALDIDDYLDKSAVTIEEFYEYLDNKIQGTPFYMLLQDVSRNGKRKYLVVLVRPSGFDNLILLRNYILGKKIDIGYEPLDKHWNFKVK